MLAHFPQRLCLNVITQFTETLFPILISSFAAKTTYSRALAVS
jgi:hypothetical protein